MKAGISKSPVVFHGLLPAVAMAWFLWIRGPALQNLPAHSALWLKEPLAASELAGIAATNLENLPPLAAAICEYVNDRGISEYDLDQRLFADKDTWYQRTVVGCWPKRLRKGSKDTFMPAAFASSMKGCRLTTIAEGVVHVACPD